MLSYATFFLWLSLPPLIWLFREDLPFPIIRRKPILLYVAVLIAGTISYVGAIWLFDKELEYAARRFDLDRDGEYSPSEYTPDAREALQEWTSDTGRRFAPLFAAPVTFIYASLWFAILIPAGRLLGRIKGSNL